MHLAGATLSAIDKTGRAVALPVGGGRLTPLGPPTRVLADATGDASGYAWIANGCVRTQPVVTSTGEDDSRSQYCALGPLAVGVTRTVRLVVPDLGFGDASFSVSAEGPDLADGDQNAAPTVHGRRPPLSLEVPAHPKSLSPLLMTVRSQREGTVRLQVRRGHRHYTGTVMVRRARQLVLRLPARLARERGVVAITARSSKASTRARLQPVY